MTGTRSTEDARITAALNQKAGLSVQSVFELVNSKNAYPQAIPILLECLPSIGDKWIKEGVVRALSVKEARGIADRVLVNEFDLISPMDRELQSLKWAIGNALSVVATDVVQDHLVALALDRKHGKSREMIVVALANFRNRRIVDVLIKLLDDDEVCGHAIVALAKLKAREAVPLIQRFNNHSRPWVRREAEKALDKLAR